MEGSSQWQIQPTPVGWILELQSQSSFRLLRQSISFAKIRVQLILPLQRVWRIFCCHPRGDSSSLFRGMPVYPRQEARIHGLGASLTRISILPKLVLWHPLSGDSSVNLFVRDNLRQS